MDYSAPPSYRDTIPNNFVLIREVSFGEREHHMHHSACWQEFVSFLEVCPLLESVLSERDESDCTAGSQPKLSSFSNMVCLPFHVIL